MKNIPSMVYDKIRSEYGIPDVIMIREPVDVLQVRKIATLSRSRQEKVIVLTINGYSNIIKSRIVTVGTLNHSLIHPREIFRGAILDNAHSIICVHNHPSGNLEPSSEDIAVTKQLKEAGSIIGISLLDHIIVSKNGVQSLRGLGYL